MQVEPHLPLEELKRSKRRSKRGAVETGTPLVLLDWDNATA